MHPAARMQRKDWGPARTQYKSCLEDLWTDSFSHTDDEEASDSSPAEGAVAAGRRKFDDEEDEDDVSNALPLSARLHYAH